MNPYFIYFFGGVLVGIVLTILWKIMMFLFMALFPEDEEKE